ASMSAACSSGDGGQDSGKVVIGFSQANNGDVWRINQTNNVADTCKSLMPDADVIVTDGQGKGEKQSADVDDLIARGAKVLLLTPLTADALTPAAQRAKDKGIPVVTLDRAVTIDVTQHIGADNKLIGRKAAEYVAETILGGNGGTILEIQGTLGASATTDRHDEFVNWLTANAPDVEIVQSVSADYKREQALTVMNDLLQAYGPGEVDVIYTHNDAMALGVVAALETAGRLEEFKVVGIDGQNEAIQAIKDGTIVVTFTYDNAGKEACESASKLIAGETIDPEWVIETNTIDASNVDEWIGKGF
ncbi:MAG TPA: substrate-binding domain-containing protein, partial [Candidatus Limnocylindrales bacterium]|nr:substrate-binding domain-containing protein [Candidatus Limnocylindrales bacterium]